MPQPDPTKTPNPQSPIEPSPAQIDPGQKGGPPPEEKQVHDTPLPIDPAQEKPELTPIFTAQLDPDAGFNGA
jgi:hypothetical protein